MTMQHDEITVKKRALRRTIAERRKQYPQEVLADLSAQITERILALEAYQKARTVFLYMELPGEVQMRALIDACTARMAKHPLLACGFMRSGFLIILCAAR